MSLTKASYSIITGAPINVLDYGVDSTGATDSTYGLQLAITDACASKKTLYIPSGTYKYTTLTINDSITIVGDGISSTLYTTQTNSGGVTITTSNAFIFEKIQFSSAGSQTAGAYVKVLPSNGLSNSFSRFNNVYFFNYFIGISFQAADAWNIQNCTFESSGITGAISVYIDNTFNPDNGDSTIMGCLFYWGNNVGTHIRQIASGGLKVIGNKFLYGQIHYHLSLGGSTADLLFADNSSEFAAIGNMVFDAAASVTFNNLLISNNEYTVSSGKYGILVNDRGNVWLYGVSIIGNVFGSNAAATAIALNDVAQTVLGTNLFRMFSGSTGISIGSNTIGIDIKPQSFASITTAFSGNISATGVAICNATGVNFVLTSGANIVIPLNVSLTNSVASVTIGGTVSSVGVVTGQYIAAGASTVTTLQAIANVALNNSTTSLQIVNSTGQTFTGKILISY